MNRRVAKGPLRVRALETVEKVEEAVRAARSDDDHGHGNESQGDGAGVS